jgi:hypothetical protein
MYKKVAIFFIPSNSTKLIKGQTITPFQDLQKIIYVRIILDDKDISQPTIYYGVLKDFVKKDTAWPQKMEQLMAWLEYAETKVFHDVKDIRFEDVNIKFSGNLNSIHLYDINSSEDVSKKLVAPLMKMFRAA